MASAPTGIPLVNGIVHQRMGAIDSGHTGIRETPIRPPEPIGISIGESLRVEGETLYPTGLDIPDGAPLLDIKPYPGRFDGPDASRNGWQHSVDGVTAIQRGKRSYTGP